MNVSLLMQNHTLNLLFIILLTFSSLIGALFFLLSQKTRATLKRLLISFSAGVFLNLILLRLLPETYENLATKHVFYWFLAGLNVPLFLQKFVFWHHCHKDICKSSPSSAIANTLGDLIHNFLHGTFLAVVSSNQAMVSFKLFWGLITHEIPQEIADLGVYLKANIPVKKALLLNFLTSLTTVVGFLVFSFIKVPPFVSYGLHAFIAGNLLYIALVDIIGEIHRQNYHRKEFLIDLAAILVGLLII